MTLHVHVPSTTIMTMWNARRTISHFCAFHPVRPNDKKNVDVKVDSGSTEGFRELEKFVKKMIQMTCRRYDSCEGFRVAVCSLETKNVGVFSWSMTSYTRVSTHAKWPCY